jgi:hypothetical protein
MGVKHYFLYFDVPFLVPKRRPVVTVIGLPLKLHPAWTTILKLQVATVVLATTADTFDVTKLNIS